ncbi:hypothetical protein ACO0QE_000308 [Hanseniaspora vineae]
MPRNNKSNVEQVNPSKLSPGKADASKVSPCKNGSDEKEVRIGNVPVAYRLGENLKVERNVPIYDPIVKYFGRKLNVAKSPFSTRLYKISKPNADESSLAEKALENFENLKNLDTVENTGKYKEQDQLKKIDTPEPAQANTDNNTESGKSVTSSIHILSSDDEADEK